jgi:hypothetical protein
MIKTILNILTIIFSVHFIYTGFLIKKKISEGNVSDDGKIKNEILLNLQIVFGFIVGFITIYNLYNTF